MQKLDARKDIQNSLTTSLHNLARFFEHLSDGEYFRLFMVGVSKSCSASATEWNGSLSSACSLTLLNTNKNSQTTNYDKLTTQYTQPAQHSSTRLRGVSNWLNCTFDLIWRGVIGNGSRCPSCDWSAHPVGYGAHLKANYWLFRKQGLKQYEYYSP